MLCFRHTHPSLVRRITYRTGAKNIPFFTMVILSFGSRLYGRQDAVNTLQQVYQRLLRDNRATTNPPNNQNQRQNRFEFVLISGDPGSGKSVLAQTLQSSVQQDGGFLGNGKFDRPEETSSSIAATALLPLIMALSEWIHQIHQQDEASSINDYKPNNTTKVQAIRDAILQQLSEESQSFLSHIIPGLDMIFANAPNRPTLSNSKTNMTLLTNNDSRQATKVIFSKFILAIISAIPVPFILSLDDLQWADDLTLDVLHQVLTDTAITTTEPKTSFSSNKASLLLLGTIRKDEASPSMSRFLSMLQGATADEEIEDRRDVNITYIAVANLTESNIQELVTDVLKCSAETSRHVAAHIYAQTKGNPLFVRQALQSFLDDSGLLKYHAGQDGWEWKDDKNHTSNKDHDGILPNESKDLLATMKHRMIQHDESVQYQLKVAACLGTRFPVDVWHIAVAANTVVMTDWKESVIINTDPNTLLKIGYLTTRHQEGDAQLFLQWQHDCVLQAAYSLIPVVERPAWHGSIGRALWQLLPEARTDEIIFLLVSQLSLGAAMLVEPDENIGAAKLCLRAGEKAALSSSFHTAASCFNRGILFLNNGDDRDNGWKQDYDLCLALHNAAAEASFCIADIASANRHFDSVLQYSISYKDSLRARTMQIYSLGTQGRYEEAYHKGIEALGQLGVRFPSRNTRLYTLMDFWWTQRMLQGKKDRTLLSLPTMKDENMLAAMSILFVFIITCSNYRPRLLPFITTCTVRMTLKHGLCPASAQAFLSFGVYQLHLGNRSEAFRFGQLALSVVETLNANEFLPRIVAGVYNYTHPFSRPLRESFEPLEYAHRVGLETGDIDMAGKGLFTACRLMLWAGKSLPEVQTATRRSLNFIKVHKIDSMTNVHTLLLQLLDNLMVTTHDPLVLTGAHTNQEGAYEVARQGKHHYMLIYLPMSRLWLALYLNDYELAWEVAAECRNAIYESRIIYFVVCVHRFLEGMAAVALSHHSNMRQYMQVAKRNLKELKEYAQDAPSNCQNKVLLLEAEMAANEGNMDMALAKFVRSADLAGSEGLVHEQALACERAGMALRRCSDFPGAVQHLVRARDLYQKWGANVKVSQMTQMYSLPVKTGG